MPQRLHHDVDLDTMPLIAFNAKAVKNSKDGKTFMIRNQVKNYLLHFIQNFYYICAYSGLLIPVHRYFFGGGNQANVSRSQIYVQTQVLFRNIFNDCTLVRSLSYWTLALLHIYVVFVIFSAWKLFIEPHSLTGNNRTNSLG